MLTNDESTLGTKMRTSVNARELVLRNRLLYSISREQVIAEAVKYVKRMQVTKSIPLELRTCRYSMHIQTTCCAQFDVSAAIMTWVYIKRYLITAHPTLMQSPQHLAFIMSVPCTLYAKRSSRQGRSEERNVFQSKCCPS